VLRGGADRARSSDEPTGPSTGRLRRCPPRHRGSARPVLSALPELARTRFRARVSGDPTGAPDWVRDIARVGAGPGWFEPDGVVWRVHGDLATLVGGVGALLGRELTRSRWPGCSGTRLPARPVEAARGHRPLAGGQHLRQRRAGAPGVRAGAWPALSRVRRGRAGRRTPPPTRCCCAGCTWPSPTPSWPRTWRGRGPRPAGSAGAGRTPTSGTGGAAPRLSARPSCRRRRPSWPRR
jgi:hypothetical protein